MTAHNQTPLTAIFCCAILFHFCSQVPSSKEISELQLRTGTLISCGPDSNQFGVLKFPVSGDQETQRQFDLGVKLLHSFEYEEAEKIFAGIVKRESGCAMAYWGIAMANFHPLWTPPAEEELKKGAKAIHIAQSLKSSEREKNYINAIAAFYNDWQTVDHRTRCLRFENEMENLYTKHPDDPEATIFYALSLDAAADPADKSFVKQIKAGSLLQKLYPGQPSHPGILHYLIHTYDYPELAVKGLEAARKYASIAPSSAHALHMPSHIFTRLGLWDESIASNKSSVASAQCYAQQAGIKGHWDEEIHGLDYLVYAYLQKRENDSAKKISDYLNTITQVSPENFKVAYAFAAIPSRYVLENKLWTQAARLPVLPKNFSWDKFPWQQAIFHFTRALGGIHTGDLQAAKMEIETMKELYKALLNQKDAYKANQVDIQIKAAEAWAYLAEGREDEALVLMKQAADMEDKTEKHPVTPGEVIPARELLGEMLLKLGQPQHSLHAFEETLKKHPNRFNTLSGALLSAKKVGNNEKVTHYRRILSNLKG